MARIRTIKPDFFTSLTISELTLPARLTFIGLWTHADDAGRCVDDVRLIRAALWALDDRTFGEVEKDLEELSGASLIRRYMISGKRYLEITGWTEHQKISHPSKSKLPGPNKPTEQAQEDSGNSPEELGKVPVADPEGYGEERKGKEQGRERKGKEEPTPRVRARGEITSEDSHRLDSNQKTAPKGSGRDRGWTGPCPEHGAQLIDRCDACRVDHGRHDFWVLTPWTEREVERVEADARRRENLAKVTAERQAAAQQNRSRP